MIVENSQVVSNEELFAIFSQALEGRVDTGSTRHNICDAAEALFATLGFHGASVREIFKRAGVNTGLMSYYFESKQALYIECINRRMSLLNDLYLKYLERLKSAVSLTPSPEQICYTYSHFFLFLLVRRDLGLTDYVKLLAQTASVYDQYDFESTMKPFDVIIQSTVDMLQQAMPYRSQEELQYSVHFLELGLVSMICSDRVRELRFGDIEQPEVLVQLAQKLADFYGRGMR